MKSVKSGEIRVRGNTANIGSCGDCGDCGDARGGGVNGKRRKMESGKKVQKIGGKWEKLKILIHV